MTAAARATPVLLWAATLAIAALIGTAGAFETKLTVGAVALAASVAAVVVWPDAATLLVVFLVYANVPAVAVNDHGVPLLLGAVVPLVLIVPLAHHLYRGEKIVVNMTFLLIILFLVVQIVSTLHSAHPDVGYEKMKTFALEGLISYFLLTNVIRTPAMLRRAMWTVLLAGAGLALVTVFQKVTGTYTRPYGGFGLVDHSYFLGHTANPRVSGPIGDPNYYAQILLVAVPFGLLVVWRERRALLRFVALGAALVVAVAIMLTFSRGAGLAFIVMLVLMGLLRCIRLSHVVPIALAILLLVTLVPAYKARFATVTNVGGATAEVGAETQADVSVRSRTTEMLAAAFVFADHPVLGVGPAAFPLYYQPYAERVGIQVHETVKFGQRAGEESQRQSHDMFLSVAADLGVVGLVVFVGILGSTFVDLVRARRRWLATRPDLANLATAFILAVACYVTTGLFLTLAFERYFWLLLALAGAAGSVALSERSGGADVAGARER